MVPSIRTHFFYPSFPNPKPLVGQAGTTLPATIFAWLTWNGLNQLHFQWSHSDWTTAISTYNCKTFVCTVWKPATGGPVQTTHSSRTVQMSLNAQNHSTLTFCNSTITDLTTFHRFCKVGTFASSERLLIRTNWGLAHAVWVWGTNAWKENGVLTGAEQLLSFLSGLCSFTPELSPVCPLRKGRRNISTRDTLVFILIRLSVLCRRTRGTFQHETL